MDSFFKYLPINFYWLDKDGYIIWCNANQLKEFGIDNLDTIKGKHVSTVTPQTAWDNSKKIMVNKKIDVIEETHIKPSGEKIIYLSAKSPILDEQQNILGLIGISINITDRKKMEEELKRAKEAAETASLAKTQFMQNMEHDLRTPTSGIAGLTEILEKKEADPEIKILLHHLNSSATQLLKLLDDIIHASRTQVGKLHVYLQEFDLIQMVNNVIDLQRPITDMKKLQLTFNCQPDVPQIIICDEHRISRILINLIGNAVKFTHQGFIKVGLAMSRKTH